MLPPVTPDDMRAAIAARSELGDGYEQALTDSLLERIDDELRLGRRRALVIHDAVTIVLALGSIGLCVVFALVAERLGELGGTLATIVAWVGVVVVNVAHARSRRR